MVYDCFSFFNELDILDIRLNTLAPVVDRFVLVESTLTHAGHPKPLYFHDNRDRFAAFATKIDHIVVDEFPEGCNAWGRENIQRNAGMKALAGCSDDDIIIVSDADEIPNVEAVSMLPGLTNDGLVVIELLMFNYFLDVINIAHPRWHQGTRACTYAFLRDEMPPSFADQISEYYIKELNDGLTFTRLRFSIPDVVLQSGGWHFTYMGGTHAVRAKLEAFAHQEFNVPALNDLDEITHRLATLTDLNGETGKLAVAPIADVLPAYVVNNVDRFSHLLFKSPGQLAA